MTLGCLSGVRVVPEAGCSSPAAHRNPWRHPIIRNITPRNTLAALAVAGFSLAGIATLSACGESTVGTPVPGHGQSAPPQVEREDVVNHDGGQAGPVDPGPQDGGAGNPGSYSADPGPVIAPQAAPPAPHPVQQPVVEQPVVVPPVVEPPVVEPPHGPKGPFEGPGKVGDSDVLDPGQAEPPAGPKGPFEGPGHVDSGVLDPGQAAPPVGPKQPLPGGPGGPVIGP